MRNFKEFLEENYLGGVIPNDGSGFSYVRANQPQIDDISALVSDLIVNKKPYLYQNIQPSNLIPTQAEFNDDKVVNCIRSIADNESQKPIITSNDNYVIDGHHRWLAHNETGQDVPSLVVNMPLEEIHQFLQNKPYISYRGLNESILYEPIDDDFLKEAKSAGKKVTLYKPEIDRHGAKYFVYAKNKKGIIKKIRFNIPKTHQSYDLAETLLEGEYVDNIRRQLIDILRLRLSIADISDDKFNDLLKSEIDKIMSLTPDKVFKLYNTQIVNNDIYDVKNLNEGIRPDIHSDVARANDHDDIVKLYRKHFRDSPDDIKMLPLVRKSTRGMFMDLANSDHHEDAYIAAKHGDNSVRDTLKNHYNMAVRFNAAISPNTHADLMKDTEKAVRYNVAKHATDHKVLRTLAADPDIHVAQMALARSKEIGNPKHIEVFTKHNITHGRAADDLQMSHLTPKFEDDVRSELHPNKIGMFAPLAGMIRKKWKGLA